MPRLRPRWATPTSDERNVGSSTASAANSSITTTSRGSTAAPGGLAVRLEVGRAGGAEQPLPPADLGVETADRPRRQPVVEIGHQPDGVGQLTAGVERGPALVVDEHERDVVGTGAGRDRRHHRAQQLALARAGGAGHQRVRAIADEVDGDHPVAGRAEHGDRMTVGSAASGRQRRSGRRSVPARCFASSCANVTVRGSSPAPEASSGSWSAASRRAAAAATSS